LSIATTKRDLLNSLKDGEFRTAFNLENVYTTICFQLRALREQREMTQGKLGKAAHMAPERISILEDPNAESKPTLNTLLRLAGALDVGLDVRFVPFSTVLMHSVNTDMQELEVISFDDELPALEQQIAFEEAVEKLHISDIGATHASNNLVVLRIGDAFEQRGSSLIPPVIATQLAGIETGIPLSQQTVPTKALNAQVAHVA
jgi:transcriptional regulator with XRE-family HTH domain